MWALAVRRRDPVTLLRFQCGCRGSGQHRTDIRQKAGGVQEETAKAAKSHRRVRVFWSLAVMLALLLTPLFTIATHGPGAYADAMEKVAQDIAHNHSHDHAHGHSHDGTSDGSNAHDATDHEHQSFAVLPRNEHPAPSAEADDLSIEESLASGLERDGLRRPPRLNL